MVIGKWLLVNWRLGRGNRDGVLRPFGVDEATVRARAVEGVWQGRLWEW